MKRTSNSGLYHIGKEAGKPVRLWERLSAGVRRRLAFRNLKTRADEGRDPEASFWLARLKLSHGQYERGWRILNELWFQGYREEAYVDFLWKQAGSGLAIPTAGRLNLLDHRVRWNLALFFWEREARNEVPEFIVSWLEQGWLGSMEFRILCDQIRDTGLLVKLVGVLTDHSAHNALLHILYRRLWNLIQENASRIGMGEIRVLLAGLDYLPPTAWQFCYSYWQDRGHNDQLEDLLTDYFLLRRERGFFQLQAIKELGKAKVQKAEKSLRAARLFNYLRLREFRSEEWNLALAHCILPAELPPDPAWLERAQDWAEMSVADVLVLLGRVFRSGCRERELVISLGMFLLNSPEGGQVGEISDLALELWKFREHLPDAELVRLGTVLAREMTDLGKYEQALEITEECFAVTFRSEELYLIGLKAAIVLGKIQEAVALLEKAEGCLHRAGLAKVRREAALPAFSRGIIHPAFARAQLDELAGENEEVSSTVLARYLLSSGQLSGEELYYLRDIVRKRFRTWGAGKGLAVREPLYIVLVRQEGVTDWNSPGKSGDSPGKSGDSARKYGHSRLENLWDPVYSLHTLLNKLRTVNREVLAQDREAVSLAYKLWRSGVARREETVLDLLVTAVGLSSEPEESELAQSELAESKLAESEPVELLEALGEYCLEKGRVDKDAGAVYRKVYRLGTDNLPNLYYLCKSLLSVEIAVPDGPGYGANVQVWGSVFSGESKLPALIKQGVGLVVQVRRVFSERLTYKVQYIGGEETAGELEVLPAPGIQYKGAEVNPEEQVAGDLEIFVQTYRHFPNFLDNVVNLALLSPFVNLEAELKLQVLERCLNLQGLKEDALVMIRRELAKLMLKQENFARVRELLLPEIVAEKQGIDWRGHGLSGNTEEVSPDIGMDGRASELAPEALEALWAVGCQVSLGLAAGEEALKALTGSEYFGRVLAEHTDSMAGFLGNADLDGGTDKGIRGTGDGLV